MNMKLLKSKIAELQATVQMLMEHKDRSSMCSSSVASSSVESYSRRSTIDSISTGATSYHQPTNMTLIQQVTRIYIYHNIYTSYRSMDIIEC